MTNEPYGFMSKMGIRARVVVPLITICLLLSSVCGWMIHQASDQQTRDHLTARAAAIARAICHHAQTTRDEVELQRFVAAMAAQQDVKRIVVASGDPLTVIAASKAVWVGLPASSLPDQECAIRNLSRTMALCEQHAEFQRDAEKSVDFIVRLRTRIRAAHPLAWSDGVVILQLDGRPHVRRQAVATTRLLTVLLVTVAIAAAAAYGLISFLVLRPIKRIATVVRLVAKGSREVRVNNKTKDELGRLASDVDMVLDELLRREEVETQAKERAISCQREMEAALAKLACSNQALDQHAIVAITDLKGVITYVNDKFCKISQYSRAELIGSTHRIVNSDYHPKSYWVDMWRTVARGKAWHGEVCNQAKDGSRYWVDTTIVPYKDKDDRITKFVAVRTDITARKTLEQQLRQSQERFELAVRGSNDGIWDWDIATGQVYYSSRYKELLGYAGDEFPNNFDAFRNHLNADDLDATLEALERHLDSDEPYDVKFRLCTKSGNWRWFRAKGIAVRDSNGNPYRMAGSISDITGIKEIEAKLATEATHDRLTGLANRGLFLDRLEHALESLKRQSRTFALLFLDFDRFKLVNDRMGHEAGDELLRQIANRLTASIGSAVIHENRSTENTIARLGGDEFVVLLENFSHRNEVRAVTNRTLQALSETYRIAGQEVSSTASIGVVFGSPDYDRADEIVCDADIAMYEAKQKGKGCYVVFDDAARARRQRRIQLDKDFKCAMKASQLLIEYEPIVDIHSGLARSLETHLRWEHPTHGRIESDELLAIIEESGNAVELVTWMLSTACGQLQELRQRQSGKLPAALNINLSPRQFFLSNLPEIVSHVLEASKTQPSCLHLELTEAAFTDNMTEAMHQIERLRAVGVRVAIDHFGVGTSSFTSLHRLAIELLKIDRSMLVDLKHSKQSASMIHGLAVIVRNIGISLIATGIENAEQLIALQGLGCDLAQGTYFGPPMSAQQIERFLFDNNNDSYQIRGAASFAVQWTECLEGQAIADRPVWSESDNHSV